MCQTRRRWNSLNVTTHPGRSRYQQQMHIWPLVANPISIMLSGQHLFGISPLITGCYLTPVCPGFSRFVLFSLGTFSSPNRVFAVHQTFFFRWRGWFGSLPHSQDTWAEVINPSAVNQDVIARARQEWLPLKMSSRTFWTRTLKTPLREEPPQFIP